MHSFHLYLLFWLRLSAWQWEEPIASQNSIKFSKVSHLSRINWDELPNPEISDLEVTLNKGDLISQTILMEFEVSDLI